MTQQLEFNMPLVGGAQTMWRGPHYETVYPIDASKLPQVLDAASKILQEATEAQEKWEKEEGAVKHDGDKPPLNLLSNEALVQIAKVMQFGAQKYAAHNWRKGFAWSRPLAAAQRHIGAFNDGEDKDPESGLSHLAHAACCIMFLLEFEKTHKHLDDRYKVPENV